jgi:hypothetical protein
LICSKYAWICSFANKMIIKSFALISNWHVSSGFVYFLLIFGIRFIFEINKRNRCKWWIQPHPTCSFFFFSFHCHVKIPAHEGQNLHRSFNPNTQTNDYSSIHKYRPHWNSKRCHDGMRYLCPSRCVNLPFLILNQSGSLTNSLDTRMNRF